MISKLLTNLLETITMKSFILRLAGILALSFIMGTTLTAQASFSSSKYMIVMDAGSTGTRAYLYSATHDNGSVTVNTLKSTKISPAVTAVEDFHTYFETLLKGVQDPNLDNNEVTIYLHATAGVRMLPSKEQTALMDDIRSALHIESAALGYPDMTETLVENVDVLTVEEEAYYIWINDQYVSGKLLNQGNLLSSNTFTAVEMGGASAEVSAVDPFPYNNLPYTDFPHYNQVVSVYATGYDGSGQDAALATMLETYLEKPEHRKNFAGCFSEGASYPLTDPVVHGTGNFDDCKKFIKNHPVNKYQEIPHANTQYLLTSSFFYTFKVLGLANDAGTQVTTLEQLKSRGKAFCNISWLNLKELYPTESEEYLVKYCFNSAFQHTYLNQIGVPADASLLSVDKYNGEPMKPMTWTLGVAYRDML